MDDAMRRRVMMGPMPYFTVEQGLNGLERGLRTGLPGYSTFICNPPMMFGMVSNDQDATGARQAQYSRNFYYGWVPHGAPWAYDKEHLYDIYKMYKYLFSPYDDGEHLYFDNYVAPFLEDKEDEDVMIERGGYGGF